MSTAARLVAVYNRSRDTFVGKRVEVADSSMRRLIGLLSRSSLPPGGGLLLFPSNSIHTFGMRFAIDVVFLDRELRVLGLCKAVAPYRVIWPRWKAQTVLELPVHAIESSRTEIGDELVLSDADAAPSASADANQSNRPAV